MSVRDIIEAGLVAQGATGLVNTEEPCGCGLDDLMPCGEACPDCEAAYAVLCNGTNCEGGCEARPHPNRPDFETTCFVAVGMMDEGKERNL
ncbi:MAG: hypothetical protein M0R37_10450 [Bacteroidales bacterium]|jgi:hypothetical protein|nr:hypothetical protein [Bacteroidales bacterium]